MEEWIEENFYEFYPDLTEFEAEDLEEILNIELEEEREQGLRDSRRNPDSEPVDVRIIEGGGLTFRLLTPESHSWLEHLRRVNSRITMLMEGDDLVIPPHLTREVAENLFTVLVQDAILYGLKVEARGESMTAEALSDLNLQNEARRARRALLNNRHISERTDLDDTISEIETRLTRNLGFNPKRRRNAR